MGWEQRGGGKFYYRKRRVGGRVVSEYVGNSDAAELNAWLAAEMRRERKEEKERMEEALAEDQRADRVFQELDDWVHAITHGYLTAHGFHQHKGEWRHKHEKTK
jgi:hypothetical protein